MSTLIKVLWPDSRFNTLEGRRRRGPVYVSVDDVVAFFHKGAADPRQEEPARTFMRMAAEQFEHIREEWSDA